MERTQMLQKRFRDNPVKYGLIAFVSLFVVVFSIWLIISLFKPAVLNIKPTNISLDSGVDIHDNKMIVYSGSSFIQIDPTNNTVDTIYTPKTRFPSVEDMKYAPDQGIFMTFSGNILETPVFDYKLKHDESLSSDNNFVWYLDFKTDKLNLVTVDEINNDLVYYNSADKTFYFISGNDFEGYNDFMSFNTSTMKTKTVSNDIDFYNITSMSQCGDDTCVIGELNSSRDKSSVAKISNTGKVSVVDSIDGEILPTPDNMTFAYLTEPDNTRPDDEDAAVDEEDDHDEYGAGIVSYQKLDLVNISTGEKQEYSGLYKTGGSIGIYDDHFYYMSGVDDTYQYLKKSTHDINFKYDSSENDFADGFINIKKVGKDFALIADVDRNLYILSTDSGINVFNRADENKVSDNIDACVKKVNDAISVHSGEDIASVFDTDFEIMVPDDKNFNSNISNMNKCIGEDSANLVGYSYMYTGISPTNGKITTE